MYSRHAQPLHCCPCKLPLQTALADCHASTYVHAPTVRLLKQTALVTFKNATMLSFLNSSGVKNQKQPNVLPPLQHGDCCDKRLVLCI
jgi:hypothetical protein